MNWGELAGLEASGRRIMGHNGFKEAAMVDDYTAKMTELIELMRLIGNDTQQCEVKECKRKISSTITDTLSAFSNGSGGWIILGLSEKNGFTPVEGFDARAMQEALSQACEKMTPVGAARDRHLPGSKARIWCSRASTRCCRATSPASPPRSDRTAARSSVPATATGA